MVPPLSARRVAMFSKAWVKTPTDIADKSIASLLSAAAKNGHLLFPWFDMLVRLLNLRHLSLKLTVTCFIDTYSRILVPSALTNTLTVLSEPRSPIMTVSPTALSESPTAKRSTPLKPGPELYHRSAFAYPETLGCNYPYPSRSSSHPRSVPLARSFG